MMPWPLIAMVTDRHRSGATGEQAIEGLIRDVERAARAGVDLIQIRERGLNDRRLVNLVVRIIAAVRTTTASVLVNERTDVAIAAGAAGVHLRSSSAPAARIRTLAPKGFIVGRSVHTREEALIADHEGGCDYLVFGTVFPSAGKPPGHAVAGVDALKDVCAAVRLPVLAIGGITEGRAREAASAGAAGVAAIGLFARQDTRDESLREIVTRIKAAF